MDADINSLPRCTVSTISAYDPVNDLDMVRLTVRVDYADGLTVPEVSVTFTGLEGIHGVAGALREVADAIEQIERNKSA